MLTQKTEISVHAPSPFVAVNWQRIIPDWTASAIWVVIVLQRSRVPLTAVNPAVEREKERLRNRLLRFGFCLASVLGDRGLIEIIDPRTGYPLLSRPGEMTHDDVAVVQALLGYSVESGQCSALVHPRWQTAVYPGILFSSASSSDIEFLARNTAILNSLDCRSAKEAISRLMSASAFLFLSNRSF